MYKRIVMIKSFKRQSLQSSLLGLLVLLLLCGCTLTSPKVSNVPSPNAALDHEFSDNANIVEGLILQPEQVEQQLEELAQIWAEALKTRDGKPRYEMMSENAKQKFEQEQIERSGTEWNFNIGNSSPWVVEYTIKVEGLSATITYLTQTSVPETYHTEEVIEFKQDGDSFIVEDYTIINVNI